MRELIVLAKYWQSGEVKTRLAADFCAESGSQIAANIYREFVGALLRRFAQVADRRTLCGWPEARLAEMEQFTTERAIDKKWQVASQGEGDLGDKMRTAFERAFANGAERAVLIGSDSPNLPIELAEGALEMLEHQQVVLGPTPDGGYYLVGARDETPKIFDHISWSSSTVWSETVQILEASNVRFAALPPWYDVDDLAGFLQLCDDLENPESAADPGLVELKDRLMRVMNQM